MKKLLMVVAIAVVAVLLVGNSTKKESIEWVEYVVERGDTLCDIAIRFTPNDIDYRKTADAIIEKSNIENSTIYSGQTILVPVYK